MQDYKSLCAAVMIWVTLVNIQTDGHTHIVFDQSILLGQPTELQTQQSTILHII